MASNQRRGISISDRDMAGIRDMLSDISKGAEKAVSLAINKTISTTKTQITKKLGDTLNLKAARIKKDIQPDKATTKKLHGSIVVKGEPVGLINFAGSQLKTGVKVKVFKAGTAKLLKHAFITTIRGNSEETTREHLFWRLYFGGNRQRNRNILNRKRFFVGASTKRGGDFGRGAGNYRFKLHRLTGPRIEDILAKDEILNPINQDAANLLLENTDKAVLEILRRHSVGV